MSIQLPQQDTGSTVYQVTEDSLQKSNIYCETPYCSGDSRYFVFAQTNPRHDTNRTEYVICELGTWEMCVGGRGIGGPAITREGMFYFLRDTGAGVRELIRLNLSTGSSEIVHVFPEGLRPRSLGTVSPRRTVLCLWRCDERDLH